MNILIACEESQAVTKAFRLKGHVAFSCDLQPCSGGHPEWHIQDDIMAHLDDGWDLMIAHPPCTYLSNAGIGWFNELKYGEKARERKRLRDEALDFVMKIANANIPKVAIENPVGWINSHWKKPTQIIQPYFLGTQKAKGHAYGLKGWCYCSRLILLSQKYMVITRKGKRRECLFMGTII